MMSISKLQRQSLVYLAGAVFAFLPALCHAQGFLITTVAGNGVGGYSGDNGPAGGAELAFPQGMTVDTSGNLYIADTNNSIVRKVAADGTISTFAGVPGAYGNSGDGGPAVNAQFYGPDAVAWYNGNLYIADTSNNVIRKVAADGTISLFAGSYGTGTAGGYSGDGGPAVGAQLFWPAGLAVDASGNVYIADFTNNVIREVTTDGKIATVAGDFKLGAGYSGDNGPATSAQLNNPYSVAVDSATPPNIYIADRANHVIRKVAANGTITTVAGDFARGAGYSGDTGPATSAQLALPTALALDAAGNLYITDTNNSVIREVSGGVINTIAGMQTHPGYSGDGGPALSAELEIPHGVMVDAAGNVWIADSQNNAVRVLVKEGTHAVLTAAKTHTGNFSPGQVGATYSVQVSNVAAAGATSGTVTVTEVVPAGLTLTGMSGIGWSCTVSAGTCTRTDPLSAGMGYAPITVTVNVASNVAATVVNQITATGGGSLLAGASDTTTTLAAPVLSSPPNGATGGISLTPVLNWNAAAGAASYDVYFGTASTPPFVTNTTATSYSPGTLTAGATYHWQIVARNGTNTSASATWSFTVAANFYSISGQVDLFGAGLNGVTMTLTGSQTGSAGTAGAGSYSFSGLAAGGNYTVTASLSGYVISPPSQTFNDLTVNQTASFTAHPIQVMKIGTYNSGQWLLDLNGNGTWDGDPPDLSSTFAAGLSGATYVTGDWNGDGHVKIGVYYQGFWYLDLIGNGIWDGGVVDKQYSFGWSDPNVIPVVGDWNGDGRSKIGVYYQGFWYLDYNGNGVWDGPSVDKAYNFGWAAAGVTPMLGDWTGNGTTKIGIYYAGFWYLDFIGNGIWDGGVVDKAYTFGWAAAGVTPIVGDWDADGRTKIGIYFNGDWFLDYDGNGVWDGGVTDKAYVFGASNTVTPLIGDWSGDGRAKIGFFANGHWYLDYNGNGAWDGNATDRLYTFGNTAGTAIVGAW
jgi:hypothetical protein